MGFPARLVKFRKTKGMTQQRLAYHFVIHVVQIRRYEGGKAQPTLEVIRNLSVSLCVSADELIFDDEERGPSDDLRREFEAISRFSDEQRKMVKTVLKGLILQHEAERWAS